MLNYDKKFLKIEIKEGIKLGRIIIVCFSCLLLFVLTGCSDGKGTVENDQTSSTTETKMPLNKQEAKGFGENFIKKLYSANPSDIDFNNVESIPQYAEKFNLYLTDKEFDDLYNHRYLTLAPEIANKLNESLEVADVTLKVEDPLEGSEENDEIKLSFQFQIHFLDENNERTDQAEIVGDMTIEESGETFKINRYYDRGFPVEKVME